MAPGSLDIGMLSVSKRSLIYAAGTAPRDATN